MSDLREDPPDVSWTHTEEPGSQQARAVRDTIALTLIVLGVTGLVCVCFLLDPLAGVAALSVAVIAVGVLLGLDR